MFADAMKKGHNRSAVFRIARNGVGIFCYVPSYIFVHVRMCSCVCVYFQILAHMNLCKYVKQTSLNFIDLYLLLLPALLCLARRFVAKFTNQFVRNCFALFAIVIFVCLLWREISSKIQLGIWTACRESDKGRSAMHCKAQTQKT